MFKSLLQTIPTLSGNFTLACHLDTYTKTSYKTYRTYISDAELIPLDQNLALNKKININLVNSKYEQDITRYFREVSSWFYKDTYLINKDIFEEYDFTTKLNIPYDHDRNFEFGCSRLSYHKYNYQFIFYAPIYINDVNDLPEYFQIKIYDKNNYIFKTINIPIGLNHGLNKLRIYLSKYIENLKDNIPVVWQFQKNVITYQNALDCINGVLINFNSYNVINSNNINNIYINDIDYMIASGYKNNNLILGECIPLSFMFNLEDICTDEELYYIYYNNLVITGKYMNLNKLVDTESYYDFYNYSTNYHYNYISHNYIDTQSKRSKHKVINYFNNDILYSNNEGLNDVLKYSNTVNKKYCQFKLYESDNYIINCANIFSYDSQNQFPIQKNIIEYTLYAYLINDNLIINSNNLYSDLFDNLHKKIYQIYYNNNYTNWFEVIEPNMLSQKTDTETTIEFHNRVKTYLDALTSWVPIKNNQAYKNGILYKLIDVQDSDKLKYFNVFVNPVLLSDNDSKLLANVSKTLNNETYSNQYYNKISLQDNITYDTVYVLDNSNLIYLKYTTVKELLTQYCERNNLDIDIILNILIKYFNISYQFEQLPLTNKNISKQIISDIINNTQYQNNLFYSVNNIVDKKNFYNEIVNLNFDYDYILDIEYISFYYRDKFVNIIDFKTLYNNILYPEYLELIKSYENIDNNIETNELFQDLSLLDNIMTNLNNNKETFDITQSDVDINNIFSQIINQYLANNLKNILFIYQQLCIYQKTEQNYRYVEYYNNDNIVINNDYLVKLNHVIDDYYTLYIDPNMSIYNYRTNNIKNMRLNNIFTADYEDKYIVINNLQEFNYWKDTYYSHELYVIEGYNTNENNLDNQFNIMPKYATLKDYILHYISIYYPEYHNIEISFENILTYLTPSFNDGIAIFPILINYKDINKILYINVQLCYKVSLIKYTEEFYNQYIKSIDDTENPNLFLIYRELPINKYYNITTDLYDTIIDNDNNTKQLFIKETTNNLVTPTFNTYYLTSQFKYDYQKLTSHIEFINDENNSQKKIGVYNEPFYVLKEIPNEQITEKNINDLYIPIDQNKISLSINTLDEYCYLVINYYIYNSSISFNIYNSKDYIYQIKYINNEELTSESLIKIFKDIYPYLKYDILLYIYDNIYNVNDKYIEIIKPSQVTINYKYVNKKVSDTSNYSLLYEQTNNYIPKQSFVRYFGNIEPYFTKVNATIYNEYNKIYIDSNQIKKLNLISKVIKPKDNNFIVSNINIYSPHYITYISKIDNKDLSYTYNTTTLIESKNFNYNLFFILPKDIIFTHSDVSNLLLSDLNIYKNSDICFKYFKQYLQSNYNNYKNLTDYEKKFIFNKYEIKYEENIVAYNLSIKQKLYQINYHLILL